MGKELLKWLVSYSDNFTLTLNILIIGLDEHNFELKIVNIFLHISSNIYFGCSKERSH